MRLQTATLSNQNISAYLLADTYTADADRELTVFVALNQVAGGGDYSVYLTRQLAGAGAAYMVGPITTFTVPAAQTAIAFQSITVEAEPDDVISVYVKGLVGDTTTPDIITRWFDVSAAHGDPWLTALPSAYAAGTAGLALADTATRVLKALPDEVGGQYLGLPILGISGVLRAYLAGYSISQSETIPMLRDEMPADASGFTFAGIGIGWQTNSLAGMLLYGLDTDGLPFLARVVSNAGDNITIDTTIPAKMQGQVVIFSASGGGASAADVADAVLDEAIGAHTGFLTTLAVAGAEMDLVDAPNATAVGAIQFGLATPADVEALLTLQIDGTLTFGQALAVMVARLAGPTSGGGTATIIFSNPTGTQARITMPITSAFDDRGVPTFSFTGV